MKNKKIRILCYILGVIGLAAAAAAYPFLPEQIPTSWGLNGITAYSPKNRIWFAAGLLPALAVLYDIMPYIDPRKANYIKFSRYYDLLCLILQSFLLLMLGITICESLYPGRISVGRVITVALGVLFMVIGNILPKIKPNYYMGLKTPWTLSDEEIWYKAHRLGGKTMFLAGAAILILGWSMNTRRGSLFAFAAIMVSVLIPGVMSYLWWRRKQRS